MNPVTVSFDTSVVLLQPPDSVSARRRSFLTPIPDLPGEFLLVLDNTSLDKIKRCHYAARNYLILGREPHARNAALVFGGAMHEGLEKFHTREYYGDDWIHHSSTDGFDCSEAGQDDTIRRFFLDNPTPPDDYRTVTNCLAVLAAYRRRCNPMLYPDYDWEILADSEGPIIERAFELPLGVLDTNSWIPLSFFSDLPSGTYETKQFVINEDEVEQGAEAVTELRLFVSRIHLAWSGRIDLVTRHAGRARITDHKTSSYDDDNFILGFQIASQTIGYTWAAQQMWPDMNVEGFCLNCLYFKKPAKSHTGPLTSGGPKGGKAPVNFFRSYFDYGPARIEEWKNDTITMIGDFIHSLTRNHFPLNDRACVDKFGICGYHDVCVEDDLATREALLLGDSFKSVTWNPTTGRG